MRIVISFLGMVWFAGTETYVLTVADELERLGHEVIIYAPHTGPCAEFARSRGKRIVEDADELPDGCDAVFAQDASTAYTLASRFPAAARVFVAHSSAYPLQSPPQVESVCHAVVVMNDRVARRVRAMASAPPVVRLRQPIDLQRFCFQTLRLDQRSPPRVLVLSNYTKGTRARMIERACAAAGLRLGWAGVTSEPTPTPEHQIAGAEIVISLGRGALEAMACGRAAYVFGDAGGDGWVTADSYPVLEADGFSGRAAGRAIDIDGLAADLGTWSEEMGEVGRDLACTHHDVAEHVAGLIELAERFAEAPGAPPNVPEEVARLISLEWDHNARVRTAVAEREEARVQADALRGELAARDAQLEQVRAALAELRATRRYRLACALARPLDRLRAWAGRNNRNHLD